MDFTRVYPLLTAKAEKKGRAAADEIICWFTGYSREALHQLLKNPITYKDFLEHAPALNPNREQITGVVCKVRVETIENPLMRDIRRLDKLIDELAKGKTMDKILRKP